MPCSAPARAAVEKDPLPCWIKPLPPTIKLAEFQYLWEKDVFCLPGANLQDDILRAFIECVHPYMPVLDLCDFIRVMDHKERGKGQISLLLFHAVMFAGITFVKISKLKAAGFSTRKAARKAAYMKARASSWIPLL